MKHNSFIRKALLLVWAVVCSAFAMAQEPCEISCNVEMPVCSGTAVTLSVPDNYLYNFEWSNGQHTNRIVVRPMVTTQYSVTVKEASTDEVVCQSEPFTVHVMPRFEVNFRQVKLTCSNRQEENGRNAQAIASVDSTSAAFNPPFTYQWEVSPLHIAPSDPTWAIGLEAYRYYYIKVTDGRGCTQRDSVTLRAYPNPLIEISTDPGDTVYLQNPHVTYSFENLSADSLPLSNFYWV